MPPHDSSSAPTHSTGEQRFDRLRGRIGLVLAPLTLAAMLAIPMPSLEPSAQRMAAIACFVVILWVSEAIPLAVSALLGPALAVLLAVSPATEAFAPFAHPLIFLFLGGFLLAEALHVQGVDRRAALWMLSRPIIAASPRRALVGVACTAFLSSMWISNTATTAMMVPIALGLCATIRQFSGEANMGAETDTQAGRARDPHAAHRRR